MTLGELFNYAVDHHQQKEGNGIGGGGSERRKRHGTRKLDHLLQRLLQD